MIDHERTVTLGAARLILAADRLTSDFRFDSSTSLRIAAGRMAQQRESLHIEAERRFLGNVAHELLLRSLDVQNEERNRHLAHPRARKYSGPKTAHWITDAVLTILISEREHRQEAAEVLNEMCVYEGLMAHIIDYLRGS